MKNWRLNQTISKLSCLVLFFVLVSLLLGNPNLTGFAHASNLKFAQISDVHYSNYEKDTSFKVLSKTGELFNDAICQVNNTPDVDFVMFTGDLTNQPQKEQLLSFIKYANMLNVPWYAVLGNHDVSHGGSMTKQAFFEIINGHNPNPFVQQPYYAFEPKRGYKVIGLDTIIDYKNTSQGEVSQEQLDWLKKELDKSRGDIIIVFTHVPLIEPFPSEAHRMKNSYDVKLLLKKYPNPIIVCSGHYHAVKVFREDNVLYISTPSLASYPNAFRIINISPKRKKVLIDVYLKETGLKTYQAQSKIKCRGANMLYGQEKDRNNTFELGRKGCN